MIKLASNNDSTMQRIIHWSITSALACCAFAAHAQDTRKVSELRIPPVCRSIEARLASAQGTIAEAGESKLDTDRIQQAIDSCQPGTAVELKASGANDAFVTAPLELRQGLTLAVSAGATLFASRNPRHYDVTPGACGVVDQNGRGCRPLIHVNKAHDAAIMGDGVIDGRGGAKLLGQAVSWWDLAQKAKVEKASQNVPRLIVASEADGFILCRIALRNSPNFHVIVYKTNGFTAWGVKIDTPDRWARNTDGIDPSSSSNVSILHSYIRAGDDNVAIKAGAAGPSSHITVAYNHFYSGHGMSIGSETQGGVSAVEVRDLTIDGADNGLRIKSNPTRGGLVRDVSYHDICIRDTKNPIVMETTYEHQTTGPFVPRYEDIALHDVRVLGGGKISIEGFNAAHPLKLTFDGVDLTGVDPKNIHVAHVRVAIGPGQVNFALTGEDAEILRLAGDHKVLSCEGRFVPFPGSKANEKRRPAPQVTPAAKRQLMVAPDGSGDYRSIQQAVDALPNDAGTVTIRPGTYREVVKVSKPHVRFEGDAKDPSKVVIVFDKSAETSGGTLNSATVEIRGDDFFARGITFANDFGVTHPSGGAGRQALALSVSGDRAVFRNVHFLGAQDTLFVGSKGCASEQGPCMPARQYFSDCYIEGHVDFIFGDAKAYFSHCEIHAITHKTIWLTAQSRHYREQDSGFVFDSCRITSAPGAEHIFFGRPWRPYSTVIFMGTEIQAPLHPAGWSEWHPGETHSLEAATYAEFRSHGPGANDAARDPDARQLSAAEAARYSVKAFFSGPDGWDPELMK